MRKTPKGLGLFNMKLGFSRFTVYVPRFSFHLQILVHSFPHKMF